MNAYDDVLMIPKEEEINELQQQLDNLKKMREDAKTKLVDNLKLVIDEIPGHLEHSDIIKLMAKLQARLSHGHKSVRGSRVPAPMKKGLEQALMDGHYAVSTLAKMFGLSVSYIYRFRKSLGHGFNGHANA